MSNQVQTNGPKRKKPFLKTATPYLFLIPTILLMGAFIYYPFVKTIGTSMFLTDATGNPVEFIGIENYQKIFSDKLFLQSIANTFIYTFCQVPITIAIAFCMAMAACKKRKGSRFYELAFAFPMAVSMSVAALIFKLMLNPQIGIVNHIFKIDIQWFNGEKTALLSVIVLGIWLGLGMDFLFLLSAVRGVPEDLIEAAAIDGCTGFKTIFKIYMPMMSPTIFYLICTNLATSMMMSGPVMVLTKGGPNNSTSTIIYYMYKKAFEIYNYGQSYAAAVVGFIIAFIIILISFKFEKNGVTYD